VISPALLLSLYENEETRHNTNDDSSLFSPTEYRDLNGVYF